MKKYFRTHGISDASTPSKSHSFIYKDAAVIYKTFHGLETPSSPPKSIDNMSYTLFSDDIASDIMSVL